ncbi:class II fructose-bisphosphate aldolase [Ruficoccus sp. ZRK36]|uniref:class II fructose-bisphosphate aldolase n=1 Tax=Ruficoccus sp. ZRK36 TaxID=2866311 RepID=UPI001C733D4A|nr:class II fructose-bisphosphate aldolase [Ruficoccus sp. ZRK36]QYY34331.1 class II fructose-bisphosphate aldolase [Ruficoccus sp. ZRK36]
MPLVTLNEILPQARSEKRAVCAFNVVNTETALAVLQAAEREQMPVIFQVYHRLFNTGKAPYMAALVRHLASKTSLPVALHMDHGQTHEQVRMAIEYGFSSVMYDGSAKPYEQNIRETREAVKLAHEAGLSIEGELGHIPGTDTETPPLPSADEVKAFVEETGVDAMAAAVGTAHGFYKTTPVIRTDLARACGEAVSIPLVLHGGSDTPEDKVKEVIAAGFSKMNIATEFMAEYLKALEAQVDAQRGKFNAIDLFMDPVTEHASKLAQQKIRLACGRA